MKSSVINTFMAAALAAFTVAGPTSAGEPDGVEFAGSGDFANSLSGAFTIADWFSISNLDTIHAAGNEDYYIVGCKQPGRKVRNIQVSFNHSVGDIDISVMPLSGSTTWWSTGYTDMESVALTGQSLSTVRLKIWGHAGAINDYGLFFQCVP